jgi:hypothetical protein
MDIPEDEIVFYPEDVGTLESFWAANLKSEFYYTLDAVLLAETDTCLVYAECNAGGTPKNGLNKSTAQNIAREYSRNIDPKITGVFGSIKHIIEKKPKITLLLLDIQDGYDPKNGGGYTGGYFSTDDMEDGPVSNKRDMLYIDTLPGFDNMTAAYATMAHELQHLIHYSNTVAIGKDEKDLWINEGLSTAAEYVYGGDPNNRVTMYNDAENYCPTIPIGNNFFVWKGYWESAPYWDSLANYSTAYLFFQWLRIHAQNGTGIYREILNSSYSDYRAVTHTAGTRIPALGLTGSAEKDWETLLQTWMLANVYQSPVTLYGYKNKISEMTGGKETGLKPSYIKLDTNEWPRFYPGEGIFSEIGAVSPYTPPAGSGPHIKYVGIAEGEIVDSESPYTGKYLLTFNADTNWEAGYEKGYLANTIAPNQEIFGRARSVQGKAPAMPFSYPVDARVIIEKNKRENGSSPAVSLPAAAAGINLQYKQNR